ncbi:MAG TPA: site-specific DNA-methyltransferase, partial [Hellea balneolensis]|nr:site-specific DNA-methyltransferase [Hellea balneolensis]
NLSNDGFTCKGGRMVSVNKGAWDKSAGPIEDMAFHREWIAACHRKLKPGGTIWISGTYHSIYQCGWALQEGGWHILNEICWFKPNASPNLSCRMFTASHETLIWARTNKKHKHVFNYQDMKNGEWHEGDQLKKDAKQMRSVWSIPLTKKSEKRFGKHPTQKPEALLDRIVLAASQPGDVILDPFCGSGTTGVVAVRHGRRFIGVDMDGQFLETLARPRIEAELDALLMSESPHQVGICK